MEFEFEFDLENPFPASNDRFPSLFHIENDHMPCKTYIQNLQSEDLQISIRRETIALILHFSRNFDPFVSYLAINYMDRFISSHSISDEKPWILKLFAISCILLALKMRKTEFSVSDILLDDGFMFDSVTIERMELLILGALKWRMRSVNPFSFIKYFMSLFEFRDQPSLQALKDRAIEIILKSQNEIKLLGFKPSVISASALLCSAHELFPLQYPCFRNAICSCSYIVKENLLKCYNVMQEIAIEGYESVFDVVSSSCGSANILELRCFSSSSSLNNQMMSGGTKDVCEIRAQKRQKIEEFASDNDTFQEQ